MLIGDVRRRVECVLTPCVLTPLKFATAARHALWLLPKPVVLRPFALYDERFPSVKSHAATKLIDVHCWRNNGEKDSLYEFSTYVMQIHQLRLITVPTGLRVWWLLSIWKSASRVYTHAARLSVMTSPNLNHDRRLYVQRWGKGNKSLGRD